MWSDPQAGHFDCISWSPSTPPVKPHDYRLGVQVTVRRLDRGLPLPTRAHPGDAGLDLRAAEPVALEPGARALVPTGLAVAIPEGHAGLVVPRSGLAARHGISVVNGPGLIDTGYRGELKVILINLGQEAVAFDRGERIAQLVIIPVFVGDVVEVDELPTTERGAGGFGSTGT